MIIPLMKTDSTKYAIIMIQNHETNIYHIEKTDAHHNYQLVRTIKGGDAHKQTRGGYSQNRYQRLYEISVHEYAKKVAEYMEQSCRNYKHMLLVGSCSLKKQKILELLSPSLKKKISSIVSDDQTLITDLIPRLKDSFHEDMEKDLVTFFNYVNNPYKDSYVVYGEKETFELLQQRLLECVFYCPSRSQSCDWSNDALFPTNVRAWKLDHSTALSERANNLVHQWGGFAGITRYDMTTTTMECINESFNE